MRSSTIAPSNHTETLKNNQKFFKIESLKKSEVTETFNSLDKLINETVNIILLYKPKSYNYLLDAFSGISSGQSLHASIYKGKKTRASVKNMTKGLNKQDITFIKKSLLACIYKESLAEDMPFLRHIYFSFIDKFLRDSKSNLHVIEDNLKQIAFIVNRISESYLKFVVACTYSQSIHKDDNFQDGYLGLHRAIRHYDQSKGTSFASYAKHWIKNKVKESAYNSFMVKIPKDVWVEFNNFKKTINADSLDFDEQLASVSKTNEELFSKILTTQSVELETLSSSDLENEPSLRIEEKEDEGLTKYLGGLTENESFVIKALFGDLKTDDIKIPKKHNKLIQEEKLRQESK